MPTFCNLDFSLCSIDTRQSRGPAAVIFKSFTIPLFIECCGVNIKMASPTPPNQISYNFAREQQADAGGIGAALSIGVADPLDNNPPTRQLEQNLMGQQKWRSPAKQGGPSSSLTNPLGSKSSEWELGEDLPWREVEEAEEKLRKEVEDKSNSSATNNEDTTDIISVANILASLGPRAVANNEDVPDAHAPSIPEDVGGLHYMDDDLNLSGSHSPGDAGAGANFLPGSYEQSTCWGPKGNSLRKRSALTTFSSLEEQTPHKKKAEKVANQYSRNIDFGSVGYKFRKEFDDGWYEGEVTGIRYGAGTKIILFVYIITVITHWLLHIIPYSSVHRGWQKSQMQVF